MPWPAAAARMTSGVRSVRVIAGCMTTAVMRARQLVAFETGRGRGQGHGLPPAPQLAFEIAAVAVRFPLHPRAAAAIIRRMERVRLGDAAEVKDGALSTFKTGDRAIVLARVNGGYCAVASKCPHLGGNLGKGRLDGRVIVCPLHGSRFDMRTGAVMEWAPDMPGIARRLAAIVKKPAPVQAFAVEEEDGTLYLAG